MWHDYVPTASDLKTLCAHVNTKQWTVFQKKTKSFFGCFDHTANFLINKNKNNKKSGDLNDTPAKKASLLQTGSASFLTETSVRSPWKLFIFYIWTNIC